MGCFFGILQVLGVVQPRLDSTIHPGLLPGTHYVIHLCYIYLVWVRCLWQILLGKMYHSVLFLWDVHPKMIGMTNSKPYDQYKPQSTCSTIFFFCSPVFFSEISPSNFLSSLLPGSARFTRLPCDSCATTGGRSPRCGCRACGVAGGTACGYGYRQRFQVGGASFLHPIKSSWQVIQSP